MALISFFIGGLQSELHGKLKVAQPATLRDAFTLVKIYEASNNHGSNYKFKSFQYQTNTQEPIIKVTPGAGDPKSVPIM